MAFFGRLVVCDWCDGKITSICMLNMDMWATLSGGRVDDIMCEECMAARLGRVPTEHDRRHPWWPYEVT